VIKHLSFFVLRLAKFNVVEAEWANVLEADSLDFKRGLVHLEEEAVLVFGLSLDQRSLDSAAWLQEVHTVLMAFEYLRYRLVFMRPDY
jgi:hypothetical protein